MPPLFLDVHLPPDVPPAPVAALLRSCSEAASLTCAEREAGAQTLPDAIVLWGSADFSSARVWVGSPESDPSFQELRFSERDQLDDRFASVGLIVAALYQSRQLETAPEPKSTLPSVKGPSEPTEVPPVETERRNLELRLLGSLTGGFGESWGARLELALTRYQPLGAYAAAHLSAGNGPEDLAVLSIHSAIGLESFLEFAPGAKLKLGAGALLDWTRVGLFRRELGNDEGATLRLGAEVWLGVTIDLGANWALEGRGGVCLFPESPQIFVSGQSTAVLPAASGVGQLGLVRSF